MKERLTHNLGMKILSIVLAAFVWLLIMNVADPVVTETFSNVTVQIINDEVFSSRGYDYSVESGDKVDIKVKGKRSKVDKLSESDFKATADLNSINNMYMVTITVECTSEYADELVVSLRNETMALKIEDQDTQPFNVRVVRTGDVKEGYYCYETKASSTLVQVTGSVTQMQALKEVVATVDIEGKSNTFTADCELVAYDFQGNQIDPQKLSFSADSVSVTIGICPTKPVDIEIYTEDSPAAGYYVEKVEFAPQNILIAAEETILRSISMLRIPCSVKGATENIEVQLDVADYLSDKYANACFLADVNSHISAVVTVSPLAERTLELTTRSIRPENLAEGLECEVFSVISSTVVVRGPASEIDRLTIDDLKLYIDLTGCVAGTYSRQIKIGINSAIEVEVGDVMVKLSEVVSE